MAGVRSGTLPARSRDVARIARIALPPGPAGSSNLHNFLSYHFMN